MYMQVLYCLTALLAFVDNQPVSICEADLAGYGGHLDKHMAKNLRMLLLGLHFGTNTCEIPESPFLFLGIMRMWTGA